MLPSTLRLEALGSWHVCMYSYKLSDMFSVIGAPSCLSGLPYGLGEYLVQALDIVCNPFSL